MAKLKVGGGRVVFTVAGGVEFCCARATMLSRKRRREKGVRADDRVRRRIWSEISGGFYSSFLSRLGVGVVC